MTGENSRTVLFDIRPDDLIGPDILSLLRYHLQEMHRHSPPGSVHSLAPETLRGEDVTFYSVWISGELAGCGALKRLDSHHGELKAMRTAPAHLRRGVGDAMLRHLIAEGRARAYRRLSLETGRPEPFHAAHALYRKHGFAPCPPFANYTDDPFSLCMTRTL